MAQRPHGPVDVLLAGYQFGLISRRRIMALAATMPALAAALTAGAPTGPAPAMARAQDVPQGGISVERGAYLANGPALCVGCHTPSDPMNGFAFYQVGMTHHALGRSDKVEEVLGHLSSFDPKLANKLAHDAGLARDLAGE